MKKWYTSRMLWANAIGIVAIVAQSVAGKDVIPPEYQVMILGVINLILRLVTNSEISW